jgi:folate-binding protein YgfZ
MSALVRIGPDLVTAVDAAALRDGAVAAWADVGVFELAGPGAVTAFQGLLTNDVEKAGDGAFVYGALLTPKGMIRVEGWAARSGARLTYTVPAAIGAPVAELLERYVPPRLARWSDRGGDVRVLRLAGPRALSAATAAGVPVPPAAGRVTPATTGGLAFEVARPTDAAPPPFALQITAAPAVLQALAERLSRAGVRLAGPAVLDLARILTGWPSGVAEVDDKTLPQEVRFDEIGGVSYTKGCYTGQETVSRLHFRGHPNRVLRGLLCDAEPGAPETVTFQDREIGRVTSLAWWHPKAAGGTVGRWLALGVLRREVTPGSMVRAGGVDARVVDLPFELAYVVPA